MGLITQAPKGTKDKLPREIGVYANIENSAREVAELYGYGEIRTPVFEHTELFKRGVGDTTDIVQKEMYTFPDKKGRSLTLKPEGTAPAARAAVQNGLFNEALPLKLCYVTNCYRYENTQDGRYREFSQFGAEVYGANTPLCDAELLALAFDLFDRLGMPRDCYAAEINSIGCPDCRAKYHAALREYYAAHKENLCGDCVNRLERNPMRLLDCKVEGCGRFKGDSPVILDYNCDSCREFFAEFRAALDSLGIPYTVNPRIVRGLDYYTNTVFEFVPKSGPVFGGGGRYNGLVKELGGAATPASGFALGIERIAAFMREFCPERLPAQAITDVYIAGLGKSAAAFALKLARELRLLGVRAECDIVGRSVKAQMRYADKIGAKFCLVVGDNELEQNAAALKDMSGESAADTKERTVALNAQEIAGVLHSR